MEVIIHFSHLDFSTAPHQLSAVCHFVSMFGCGTFIHPQHASTRTSINYLNLLCGGKIWFPLRAMSDDVDEIKFDKCRDARTLLRLTRIVCYPDLRASSVKDVCIFESSCGSDNASVFRVLPPLGKRSSTILSYAAILQSSICPWVSSSSRMRIGPSSGRGCLKSYGNARTATIGDSTIGKRRLLKSRGRWCNISSVWRARKLLHLLQRCWH